MVAETSYLSCCQNAQRTENIQKLFTCGLIAAVFSLFGFTVGASVQHFVKPSATTSRVGPVVGNHLPAAHTAFTQRAALDDVNEAVAPSVQRKQLSHDSSSTPGFAALGISVIAAFIYALARPIVPQSPQGGHDWTAAALALEEDYPGPGSPDEEYEIRAVWDGAERMVKVKGDQSILMACEEAGMQVPYSCRHGVCLECTAKIVEGIEHARKDSQCHNDDNIRAGYVCTCSTYVGGNGMKLIMGMNEEAYKAQFGKFEEEERQRELNKKKGIFGF